MMKTITTLKSILILTFSLYLAGCAFPKTSIESLKQVALDETIFIGRVMMSPALTEADVQLENFINFSDTPLHKSLQMKVSDIYYELGGQHASDYQDSIFTVDGDYYYFSWKKKSDLNILGATFITRSTQTNLDTMTLSIDKGVKVKHSGKSKAVYVGDITFVRDEFFNIKDIKISQKDYKKAIKAFGKKFNTDLNVEKAKLASSK